MICVQAEGRRSDRGKLGAQVLSQEDSDAIGSVDWLLEASSVDQYTPSSSARLSAGDAGST